METVSDRRSSDTDERADNRPVIVLVDDDGDCRMLIRDAIESVGKDFVIYECARGRQGLDLLSEMVRTKAPATPLVVFLDLEMPDMSGQEVLSRLRAHPQGRDVPVIMLTGIDSDEQQRLAMRNGANSYTCKGRDPDMLFDNVARAATYWTSVHRWMKGNSRAA